MKISIRIRPSEYISNVFLVEKKTKNKKRMILNLRKLNLNVTKQHFKMETLMQTLTLVTHGCFFLSFDFSDAYYSCAVFGPHRRYLRFQYDGKILEFTCLPNGLSSAPRFFTKIMKILLSELRSKGITISGFLDDNLLINYVSAECMIEQGAIAAHEFQEKGLTINVPKSVIEPTQEIEHLGFVINSVLMLVTLTPEKAQKIVDLIEDTSQLR